jgi:hypothetical protein
MKKMFFVLISLLLIAGAVYGLGLDMGLNIGTSQVTAPDPGGPSGDAFISSPGNYFISSGGKYFTSN